MLFILNKITYPIKFEDQVNLSGKQISLPILICVESKHFIAGRNYNSV